MVFEKDAKNIRELTAYEVGIMCLESIPLIGKDSIAVDVYDLSITTITIPSKTSTKKKKGIGKKDKPQTIFSPEIILNLKSNAEDKISLSECLLPSLNVLVAKASVVENESVKEVKQFGNEQKEIYTKIVYDLIVFTRKGLKKTTQTYEEYQQEMASLRASHKRELEIMRESYQLRIDTIIEPYKKNEKILREKIEALNDEINKLIMNIPEQQNRKLLEFITKTNKADDFLGNIEK